MKNRNTITISITILLCSPALDFCQKRKRLSQHRMEDIPGATQQKVKTPF